jgi:hypothetical protein
VVDSGVAPVVAYRPISEGLFLIPVVMAVGAPWLVTTPDAFQLLATLVAGVVPWQAKQAVLDHRALPLSGFAAAKAPCTDDKPATAMAILLRVASVSERWA